MLEFCLTISIRWHMAFGRQTGAVSLWVTFTVLASIAALASAGPVHLTYELPEVSEDSTRAYNATVTMLRWCQAVSLHANISRWRLCLRHTPAAHAQELWRQLPLWAMTCAHCVCSLIGKRPDCAACLSSSHFLRGRRTPALLCCCTMASRRGCGTALRSPLTPSHCL